MIQERGAPKQKEWLYIQLDDKGAQIISIAWNDHYNTRRLSDNLSSGRAGNIEGFLEGAGQLPLTSQQGVR